MPRTTPEFRVLSPVERIFNPIFRFFGGLGLGFPYNYLLQVRGRQSGKIYSTPTLKKGNTRQKYRLRPRTQAEKPEILKASLDAFRREVQRYFPVPAGSLLEAFGKPTESCPAFELQPV
jgi:hypothetical protein